MNESIYFEERQHFRQWWLVLILAAANFIFLYGIYQQIFAGELFGDKPVSNTGLVIAFIIVFLLSAAFYLVRLETKIKDDGVYVRFYPIIRKFSFYPWERIVSANVVKYRPIRDFGGWGYRISIIGKGRALNVSGDRGLQLEFTNKDKLLIGTNKPEEMENALQKIQKAVK
jgi:hypothetical protein